MTYNKVVESFRQTYIVEVTGGLSFFAHHPPCVSATIGKQCRILLAYFRNSLCSWSLWTNLMKAACQCVCKLFVIKLHTHNQDEEGKKHKRR